MTAQQIFEWCLDNWSFTLFILGMFVQFTPAIKFSPITAICKWIGRQLNGELLQRMDDLEKNNDENEMDRIKWEIFDFANECRNHIRHTKDEFQHIISLNTKYHRLLDKYELENGVFDEEYEFILELYHRCQRENDFL